MWISSAWTMTITVLLICPGSRNRDNSRTAGVYPSESSAKGPCASATVRSRTSCLSPARAKSRPSNWASCPPCGRYRRQIEGTDIYPVGCCLAGRMILVPDIYGDNRRPGYGWSVATGDLTRWRTVSHRCLLDEHSTKDGSTRHIRFRIAHSSLQCELK